MKRALVQFFLLLLAPSAFARIAGTQAENIDMARLDAGEVISMIGSTRDSTGQFSLSTDSLSKYYLLIKHDKRDRQRIIGEGRRIKIWIDTACYMGIISGIVADSILLDGIWYDIASIDRLRIRTAGTNITGTLLTSGGAITTPLGIVLLAEGISMMTSRGGNDFGVFFQNLFGMIMIATSVVIIPVGAILLGSGIFIILHGKQFNFNKHWRITTEKGVIR
ncbi:MAG TPA: hypothetical protein PLJ84_12160 [Bacteroidales bacterium]|nr:hypothetical protein [Bacteroidales bacterium]HPT03343.1 hypothetical protein [Bacteroidales bacterium]